MSLKFKKFFVKVSCPCCCSGKVRPQVSCPYCDHTGSTLVEASTKTIIKVLNSFSDEEREFIRTRLDKGEKE